MVKFYHAVREGWGREHALTRFLKDGIWAFALPFSEFHLVFGAFKPEPCTRSHAVGKHRLYVLLIGSYGVRCILVGLSLIPRFILC
jgi:hypothetical protein